MEARRTNRPTLDALRHMPVSDVIALPAEHLALLQSDAREALDGAKRMQDWIEAAIALRYERRAIGAIAHFNAANGAGLPAHSRANADGIECDAHDQGRPCGSRMAVGGIFSCCWRGYPT